MSPTGNKGPRPTSFFTRREDGALVPTAFARGPWHREQQHGGAPCALLARAFEHVLAAQSEPWEPASFHVEYLRPVPMAPLRVIAEPRRPGRRASSWDLTLVAADGDATELVHAVALALQPSPKALPARDAAPRSVRPPAECKPIVFPFYPDAWAYGDGFDARLVSGAPGAGAGCVWMRAVAPLVEGEPMTPLCAAMLVADAANGVSGPFGMDTHTYVNPNISVHLQRSPRSAWIAVDSVTRVEPHGIAVVDATLHDEDGAFARMLESTLVRAR